MRAVLRFTVDNPVKVFEKKHDGALTRYAMLKETNITAVRFNTFRTNYLIVTNEQEVLLKVA